MIYNLFFILDQREICLKESIPRCQNQPRADQMKTSTWQLRCHKFNRPPEKRRVLCVGLFCNMMFFCAKREQNDWQFKWTFGYNAFVATSSTHHELWPQIQHCLLPPHSLPSLLKSGLDLKDISVTLVEITVKPFQLTPLLFISIFNLCKDLLTSKRSSGNR